MVLYTAIWCKNESQVYPYVTIYHAFAGKRVRIKLLTWSGSILTDGHALDDGVIPLPIRIDFDDTLQANAMGVQQDSNSIIFPFIYMYPNSFTVDPITCTQSSGDANRETVLLRSLTWECPKISGYLVGNQIRLTLRSVTDTNTKQGVVVPELQYLDTFNYYKADFDIEEIN